jgi:hypothetical protein
MDRSTKGIAAVPSPSPRPSNGLHMLSVCSFALLPDPLCQRSRSVLGLFPYLPPICGVYFPDALL